MNLKQIITKLNNKFNTYPKKPIIFISAISVLFLVALIINHMHISEEDRHYPKYDKKIAEIEKKAAQRKKAYAIADTIINTAAAIIGIWKDFPKDDFGATAAIMSVGMGILGAAQVATIASTPVDGSSTGSASGGGSMPSSSGTGGTAPTTSFSFAEAPKTPETQPARTYVVSKEVTTQQQLDRQIISNGTI